MAQEKKNYYKALNWMAQNKKNKIKIYKKATKKLFSKCPSPLFAPLQKVSQTKPNRRTRNLDFTQGKGVTLWYQLWDFLKQEYKQISKMNTKIVRKDLTSSHCKSKI